MASKLMFGLSDAVIGDLRGVFARYPEIERVLIFGSRAKGTFKDGSDIDLAVVAPTMSDQRFTQLWGEIDDLQLVFKVDGCASTGLRSLRCVRKSWQMGNLSTLRHEQEAYRNPLPAIKCAHRHNMKSPAATPAEPAESLILLCQIYREEGCIRDNTPPLQGEGWGGDGVTT